MPLIKSKTKNAFSHNVEAEMHAGKPRAQSLAIAYATKRAAHKAKGGMIQADEDSHDIDNWLSDEDDIEDSMSMTGPTDEQELSEMSMEPSEHMDNEEAPVPEEDKGVSLQSIMNNLRRKHMRG